MAILVVDDSAYARKRIAKTLTQAGHIVVEADNAQSALELFAEVHPDLVTVDLLMPGMDGLELTRRLRDLDPAVPIIILSADVQHSTQEQVFAAGASWFIGKTDKPEEILRAVQTLLGGPELVSLSDLQQDAFTEIMNIAMGQAALALEMLLERHVLMKVPQVEILKAAELHHFLKREAQHVGAVVQQKFSGPLNGLAALVLPRDHAQSLVRVLLEAFRDVDELSSAEQTVLAEVGNIVLNAALARLGDQLQTRIHIGLPTVVLNQSCVATVNLLFSAVPDAVHAIVFLSRLTIGEVSVVAFLTLILPQSDVQHLLTHLAT